MGRLRSLKLEQYAADWIRLVLLAWMENGTPGSLTELSIDSNIGFNEGTPDCLPDEAQISAEVLAGFLQPIKTLSLTRVYMDWDCAAFTGLIELELSDLDYSTSPTIAQLISILAASPELQTLTLDQMSIDSSDIDNVMPIRHKSLRKVRLMLYTGLESFFAAIFPRSNQLDLCLEDDFLPEVVASLQSHWGEIHIPIFRLTEKVESPMFYGVPKALRYTQTFAYCGRLTKPMLKDLAGRHALTPIFHTIGLTSCMIACEKAFRNMILAHPVHRLRLIECGLEIDQVGLGEYERALLSDTSPLCVWLESVVPDFRVYKHGKGFPHTSR